MRDWGGLFMVCPMTSPEHVLVPALVGLDAASARELAAVAGVILVSGAAADTRLPVSGVVIAQQPMAGTQIAPGDSVEVLIEDTGGEGGTRPSDDPLPRDPAGIKQLD